MSTIFIEELYPDINIACHYVAVHRLHIDGLVQYCDISIINMPHAGATTLKQFVQITH